MISVGGGFFGHGERYYLTDDQRRLLDEEPAATEPDQQGRGRSFFDHILDIFR
ncbi:MAG: hypothetical protein WDO13_11020 [Verrucomicrobiota bacterium]